jgi:hypothetical protein
MCGSKNYSESISETEAFNFCPVFDYVEVKFSEGTETGYFVEFTE